MSKFIVDLGNRIFTFDEMKWAYHKVADRKVPLHSFAERVAYGIFFAANKLSILHKLRRNFISNRPLVATHSPENRVYDEHYLHLRLNRIYDLPEVKLDLSRLATINVLVPAFEFNSISAGFFGVFQVARFMRRTGYNVKLVLFDNFYFSHDEFRQKFLNYPGMENLLDEL